MRRLAAAAAVAALLAGCPEDKGVPPPVVPNDPGLPPAVINLPPVPDLTGPATPLRLPDGSYTVWGLSSRPDDLVGKEVLAQALVVELYACEDPPPAGQKCQAPHFWVSDSPDGKPSRLMVVGYDPEEEETPEPPVGKTIRLRGIFDKRNEQGFVASEGLVRMIGWTEVEQAGATPSAR